MRKGDVIREAGYDGEYGRIKLFQEDELKQATTISLFDMEDIPPLSDDFSVEGAELPNDLPRAVLKD